MKRKAVFFDRDGVINIDKGYVYSKNEFEFNPAIFDLLSFYKSQGYLLLVVTNQSGIARGYYSIEDFLYLTEYMQTQIKSKLGFGFDKVYFCPHLDGCNCRKPKTGMFEEADMDFGIDFTNSIMIGDKQSDMQAAQNAGIGKKFYLSIKKPDFSEIQGLQWVIALQQIKTFEEKEK